MRVAFLATGQRVQSLAALRLSLMSVFQSKYDFGFDQVLKTPRSRISHNIEIFRFSLDLRICPFTCLQVYIRQTSSIRQNFDNLFISFLNPHGSACANTLNSLVDLYHQRFWYPR